MTRVVFLGTPEFAVPSLQALAAASAYEVVGVVTQPDRPAGRGRDLRQSAVKEAALALELPIFQPSTLRDEAAIETLAAWEPDLLVVAAFGQILRQPVLDLPPQGCINVHASLLPRWRGAAPIQYAIRAGDAETGITIMLMDAGLDSGPMLLQRGLPIGPRDTAATLHDKLADLGAEALLDALPGYLAGEITAQPQPEEGVTKAPSLKKEAGEIDWTADAVEIDRQVRAYTPWPGTFTTFEGKLLKVISGEPAPRSSSDEEAGTLIALESGAAVQCGAGLYHLHKVQPAGKRRMNIDEFLAGRPDAPGSRLGEDHG